MCMRPTHISHPPASELVAAHESHDNDVLPAYDEIIRNADEETKHLIDSAYCADEKKAFEDDCELPAYEKIEKNEAPTATGKTIANVCAVLYGVIFLAVFFLFNGNMGCMQ